MRIVNDPKSVCSPNAAALAGCGCAAGGARMKRMWQPDGTERRCRDDRVFGCRWREVEREVKSVERMSLFVSIYNLRTWRWVFIRVGAEMGDEMESRSSFEI
jgi:hypothetical protein